MLTCALLTGKTSLGVLHLILGVSVLNQKCQRWYGKEKMQRSEISVLESEELSCGREIRFFLYDLKK